MAKEYKIQTQPRAAKRHRKMIDRSCIDGTCAKVRDRLFDRLNEKGWGTWMSRHEILGFATEEYSELVEAVHTKSIDQVRSELVDLAVGSLFAIACIDSNTVDW